MYAYEALVIIKLNNRLNPHKLCKPNLILIFLSSLFFVLLVSPVHPPRYATTLIHKQIATWHQMPVYSQRLGVLVPLEHLFGTHVFSFQSWSCLNAVFLSIFTQLWHSQWLHPGLSQCLSATQVITFPLLESARPKCINPNAALQHDGPLEGRQVMRKEGDRSPDSPARNSRGAQHTLPRLSLGGFYVYLSAKIWACRLPSQTQFHQLRSHPKGSGPAVDRNITRTAK